MNGGSAKIQSATDRAQRKALSVRSWLSILDDKGKYRFSISEHHELGVRPMFYASLQETIMKILERSLMMESGGGWAPERLRYGPIVCHDRNSGQSLDQGQITD